MSLIVVRHKVRDYNTWKRSFDENEDLSREYGLRGGSITRRMEDPNDLVLIFSCESLSRAREFLTSDRLRKLMDQAGVIGTPEVYYLEEIAKVSEFASVAHKAR